VNFVFPLGDKKEPNKPPPQKRPFLKRIFLGKIYKIKKGPKVTRILRRNTKKKVKIANLDKIGSSKW
jgi:hypothetical protein